MGDGYGYKPLSSNSRSRDGFKPSRGIAYVDDFPEDAPLSGWVYERTEGSFLVSYINPRVIEVKSDIEEGIVKAFDLSTCLVSWKDRGSL